MKQNRKQEAHKMEFHNKKHKKAVNEKRETRDEESNDSCYESSLQNKTRTHTRARALYRLIVCFRKEMNEGI